MSLQFTLIPVTALAQNATLLWDTDSLQAVLTDAGGEVDKLSAQIAQHGVRLEALWLTHGHVDHIGAADAMRARSGAPVIGPHQADAFWLHAAPQAAQMYGLPEVPVLAPDRWLAEGDTLCVGAYTFSVLHIPGHTPGSVVFYCAAEKLLIAGDVLFRESVGRTDFPQGNHADLIRNIREKLLTLPEDTRVIPGHGDMTTIGHEKKYNPFLQE